MNKKNSVKWILGIIFGKSLESVESIDPIDSTESIELIECMDSIESINANDSMHAREASIVKNVLFLLKWVPVKYV